MISRIVTRRLLSLVTPALSSSLFHQNKFLFAKIEKVTNFKKIVDQEIKAEEQAKNDLSQYQKKFSKEGWTLNIQQTLVELSKNTGKYEVRLLSNIKSPNNFNENEEEGEKKEGENAQQQDFDGDMNQITICVTKAGQEKTMVINTIVTQGFEISSINFAESYQTAKKQRIDIFNTNNYTGPEIETLSDELFESIYGFLEEQVGINNEIMESIADYSLDCEQGFYINWLKDLKSII